MLLRPESPPLMQAGVAVSTTGDPHRMILMAQCVAAWRSVLGPDAVLMVTVDGPPDAVEQVHDVVGQWTGDVLRVGQPQAGWTGEVREGRLGVAVSKNTGLEALMATTTVGRLWLSDDDTWPLSAAALELHTALGLPHSMVCWGRHRRSRQQRGYASWTWPRGAALYVERHVVVTVGGMVEAFGPGGHEHVEWSQRIHRAGLTPVAFPTPSVYTQKNYLGAGDWWHCEDMIGPREAVSALQARRRRLTSVRRQDGDGARVAEIMDRQQGSTAFVPYRAADNQRLSATLSPIT